MIQFSQFFYMPPLYKMVVLNLKKSRDTAFSRPLETFPQSSRKSKSSNNHSCSPFLILKKKLINLPPSRFLARLWNISFSIGLWLPNRKSLISSSSSSSNPKHSQFFSNFFNENHFWDHQILLKKRRQQHLIF